MPPAEPTDLTGFFHPRAVALVGASPHPEKVGGRRWRTLVEGGFRGRLYPVHPRADAVLGRPAFRRLRDLPEPVDLAVVAVPAAAVPGVVGECAALRIGAVAVITGGFGETGPAGREAELALAATVRRGGGRMMGPNCAGVFNAASGLNCLGWTVPAGPVALVSQSGNMTLSFVQLARETGLGFGAVLTVGNAADLETADYVRFFLDDPATRVVLVYLEGLRPGEGHRLCELLRAAPGGKPVVVLKPGTTAAAGAVAEVARRHREKPLVVHSIYAREALDTLAPLRAAGIPLFSDLEGAARALGALAAHRRSRRAATQIAPEIAGPPPGSLAPVLARAEAGTGLLLEPDARRLLALFGIRLPPSAVAGSAEACAAACADMGGRVALKLVAPGLAHKSDVGGVLLDVRGDAAARAGFRSASSGSPRSTASPPSASSSAAWRSWLRGLNVQPFASRLPANDKKLYPLYLKCLEYGIPVTIHTGINYSSDRTIGFGRPLVVGEGACDFPGLTLVLNHGGWPWVGERVAVARKHPSVYIEIGGIAPKYLAKPGSGWEVFLTFADSLLQDQILFATDSMIPFERAVREALVLKPAVLEKLLHGNASRLLGG